MHTYQRCSTWLLLPTREEMDSSGRLVSHRRPGHYMNGSATSEKSTVISHYIINQANVIWSHVHYMTNCNLTHSHLTQAQNLYNLDNVMCLYYVSRIIHVVTPLWKNNITDLQISLRDYNTALGHSTYKSDICTHRARCVAINSLKPYIIQTCNDQPNSGPRMVHLTFSAYANLSVKFGRQKKATTTTGS